MKRTPDNCEPAPRPPAGAVAGCLLVALFWAVPSALSQEPSAVGAGGAEWRTGAVEGHALNPARLAGAVERIGSLEGVYSVLVVHGGELVVERYFRDGYREKPHNLKSASKSVLSALAGIAADEGLLDLDRPIVEILPGVGAPDDPRKAAITTRHLLTMTSGLEPTSYDTYSEWTAGRDWVRGALALPLVAEPGSLFQYSTGNTHLLSAVLAAATGMSTREFAESRLFGPLGVAVQGWARDPQGVHIGGNDLSLTPRDMARFGQLFLDGGRAGERQIVPPDWVDLSTRRGEIGRHDVYGTYGYLWWTDLVYEGAFAAVGYGGQYIFVSPPHDCVVVVTSTLVSKGERWTAELFAELRHGVLASFAPDPGYYVRVGKPAVDPAIDTLERAVAQAQAELAAFKRVADAEAPELPGRGRTSARVNLRRGPDTGTARVLLLERGVEVELLERSNGWMRVKVDGEEGWVRADFVSVENGSWRPLATALRNDLAAFSEAIRDRLPQGAAARVSGEPGAAAPELAAAAENAATDQRVGELERRLEASIARGEGLEARLAELGSELAEQGEALSGARARGGELNADLEKARERIADLERQMAAGTGEADTAAAALGDARRQLAALEDKLAGETERRRRLEATATEAEKGRQALAAELQRAGEGLNALEEELASSARGRETLEKQLADLVSDREALAAELAAARTTAESQVAATTAADEACIGQARELARARERLAALEEALSAAEAGRVALAGELDLQQAAAERDQAAAVEARTEMSAELELAGGRIEELEESLAASRSAQRELEERVARQRDESGRLREGLARAADSRDGLAGQLDAARVRIAELEEGLGGEREEGQLELAAARQRIATLESQLGEAASRLNALAGQLAEQEAETRRALARGSSAEADLRGQIDVAKAQIGSLEERLGESTARQAVLQAELEGLRTDQRREADRLESTESERQALAAELAAARRRISDLEGGAGDAAGARAGLEAQLAKFEREAQVSAAALVKSEESLAVLAGRLRTAEARVVGLEDQLRTAQRDRSRLVAQVSELGARGTRPSEAATALGSELRAADARIQALEGQLRSTESANLRLADALRKLRAEWEERTLQLAEATRANEALAGRQAAARGEIADLEARLRRANEERSGLAARLEAAERRRAEESAETMARAEEEQDAMAAEVAAQLVRDWAEAWSSQDPDRYLAFYAASFQPGGGLTRNAWEEQRRTLLARPRFIRVEVGAVEVELTVGGGRARVGFDQLYRSDTRQLSAHKTLELVREDGAWRIERELISD